MLSRTSLPTQRELFFLWILITMLGKEKKDVISLCDFAFSCIYVVSIILHATIH